MVRPRRNNKPSKPPKIEDTQSESAENDEKNSIDVLTSTVKTLQESVEDIRQKHEEDINDICERQEEILEALEKLKETKKAEIQIPAHDNCPGFDFWKKKDTKPTSGKEFVLKPVFKSLSNMRKEVGYFSHKKEHFGVVWGSSVYCEDEHMGVYLHCLGDKTETEEWAIEVELDIRICSKTGNIHSKPGKVVFKSTDKGGRGMHNFLKWDELMEDFVTDDSVTVEIHVKIRKMSGSLEKKKLRMFDESNKNFSDVVLIVGDEKFYIAKLFLAHHSTYFETLFLGQFQESQKAEISLTGIDSDDFQNFLEVLYGDPAIDETTVEGLLLVADMYDTQIVIGKCEDFLLEKSKKSTKKKLELAVRYNLEKLKKQCLSEIKTMRQIKAVVPDNVRDLDPSIMADLFEKALVAQH